MNAAPWPALIDAEHVERLIRSIQYAVTQPGNLAGDTVELSAPDVANALLIVLATVLESSPSCSTPRGRRQTAEAAGKELGQLMRDTRRLRQADAISPSVVN